MGLLLHIHPQTPDERQILKAVRILENNGVAIYPTDSVYGMGCSIMSKEAMERIALLKGIKPNEAEFSLLFGDIEQIVDYIKPLTKDIFRILKRNLPGPFTFILPASKRIPKLLENKRKTIGIRIPDNNIVREIVRKLGYPLVNTSVKAEDNIQEYQTDPSLIWERYKNIVDVVIDGGMGNLQPTTVVDLTGDEPEIIRQGIGELIL